MRHLILLLIIALVVAGIAYGVAWLLTGRDSGLEDAEPDGRAVPLPGTRPLVEPDISAARFDTVLRGYRMEQVDAAMRRAAYDIGYKSELINVLEAEIQALRDGRSADAETLRRAREGAQIGVTPAPGTAREPADASMDDSSMDDGLTGALAGRDELETQTQIGDPITRVGGAFVDDTLVDGFDDDDLASRGSTDRGGTDRGGTDRGGTDRAGTDRADVDSRGVQTDVTEQAPSGR